MRGISLLVDAATDLSKDEFAHRSYGRLLDRVVTGAEHSMTVGLFGAWGMGKSSALRHLSKLLDNQAGFVEFDAWRYDADSLRRQLLRDIGGQMASERLVHTR